MAIVCRKCNYKISESEINEHYKGFLLKLAKSSIEFSNNMISLFRAKIDDTPEVKQEKILSSRANEYEIRCPKCFQYNGWIRVADENEAE